MTRTDHDDRGDPPPRPDGTSTGPRSFAMPGQQVGTQVNIAGSANFRANPSTDEAVQALSKQLRRVRRSRAEELRAMEAEFGQRVQTLDQCYVVPDFQDFNPPDELNSPSLNVSREPAFSHFDRFLQRPHLRENGQRCLFVLGDAGMGKTSLLIMLKFRHLTAFLPTDHDCVLMKLGPDTVARIAAIENPAHTVLLLDSLDEDPEAHRMPEGASERLLDLLPRVVRFHRVVITCRTQFFPETSKQLTTLDGHFVIEDFECPLKYLSLFTDAQVEAYLQKHFQPGRARRWLRALGVGRSRDPRLDEARRAAASMESLRLRPLLLSYIDDFVSVDDRPVVEFLVPVQAGSLETAGAGPPPDKPLQCELLLAAGAAITERELKEREEPLSATPPLQPWPRLWPFVRRALGCLRESVRLDTNGLLRRLAARRPVTRLPYLRYPGWAERVRIVFDRHPDLAPFWEDMESLIERVKDQHGSEGLEVIRIRDGAPPAAPPAPGVPVLLLSDLGFYVPEGRLTEAWRAHGRRLQRGGHSRTALLPCPRTRWLEDRANPWTSACWDRGERLPRGRQGRRALPSRPAAQLASQVGALLTLFSPAVRVEPGLLRAIRLLHGSDADVGTEYDAWHHPEAVNDGASAMGVRAVHAVPRRVELTASATAKTKAALSELVRRWHEGLSETIRSAEIRYLAECGAPVSEEEVEDARRIQNRAAAGLLHLAQQGALGREAAMDAGYLDWQRRELARASPAARDLEEHLALGWVALRWLNGSEVAKVPDGLNAELVARSLRALQRDPGRDILWELRRQGGWLVLSPWQPPVQREGGTELTVGAPFAWLRARRSQFEVRIVEASGKVAPYSFFAPTPWELRVRIGQPMRLEVVSDSARVEAACVTRPSWASRFGQDQFGLFAEFDVEGVEFRMRWIPPGSFRMGSPDGERGRWADEEGPPHLVTISQGFWLGETPCTQEQWRAVMAENPSELKGSGLPVDSVTWDEAGEYCERLGRQMGALGFRLPTEAEWECASRAGTESAFNDGSDCTQPEGRDPALDRLGWYSGNSENTTHPVAQMLPNAWGLYDMHGNVWEWCADGMRDYARGDALDPKGPEDERAGRVVRGGCFWIDAWYCRSARRDADAPERRDRTLGFRLAAGQPAAASGALGREARGAAALGPEGAAGGPRRGARGGPSRGRRQQRDVRR